jgi:hypothetical protein
MGDVMSKRVYTLLKQGVHIALLGDREGKITATTMGVVKQAVAGFFDEPTPMLQADFVVMRAVSVAGETLTAPETLHMQMARVKSADGEAVERMCAFDAEERRWYVLAEDTGAVPFAPETKGAEG